MWLPRLPAARLAQQVRAAQLRVQVVGLQLYGALVEAQRRIRIGPHRGGVAGRQQGLGVLLVAQRAPHAQPVAIRPAARVGEPGAQDRRDAGRLAPLVDLVPHPIGGRTVDVGQLAPRGDQVALVEVAARAAQRAPVREARRGHPLQALGRELEPFQQPQQRASGDLAQLGDATPAARRRDHVPVAPVVQPQPELDLALLEAELGHHHHGGAHLGSHRRRVGARAHGVPLAAGVLQRALERDVVHHAGAGRVEALLEPLAQAAGDGREGRVDARLEHGHAVALLGARRRAGGAHQGQARQQASRRAQPPGRAQESPHAPCIGPRPAGVETSRAGPGGPAPAPAGPDRSPL
jgi:hypothetical protein